MLTRILEARGPEAKAVVWAHNSHAGDASATEMGAGGEINVGQLCRDAFGSRAYLVGFGTDRGTVAAASEWDGPMEIQTVQPSHPMSYERVCHDSGVPAFLLHLREPEEREVRLSLASSRLERVIGVLYFPETELENRYPGLFTKLPACGGLRQAVCFVAPPHRYFPLGRGYFSTTLHDPAGCSLACSFSM
jgi:erythromycin esterase-like protein